MANGKNSETVVQSSGNVFADLGLQDADEKQPRVRLAVAINQILHARRLSQTAAAHLLNINQPKISALVNYRLGGFSLERLMHFLNALDRDRALSRLHLMTDGSGTTEIPAQAKLERGTLKIGGEV